jgi:hypothetical protein
MENTIANIPILDVVRLVHGNFVLDIKQFLLAHGYVALTNDMLKVYKVAQV